MYGEQFQEMTSIQVSTGVQAGLAAEIKKGDTEICLCISVKGIGEHCWLSETELHPTRPWPSRFSLISWQLPSTDRTERLRQKHSFGEKKMEFSFVAKWKDPQGEKKNSFYLEGFVKIKACISLYQKYLTYCRTNHSSDNLRQPSLM